jgi:hypothetical protein
MPTLAKRRKEDIRPAGESQFERLQLAGDVAEKLPWPTVPCGALLGLARVGEYSN